MDYSDYRRYHQTALTILGLWPKPSSQLYWLYTTLFLGLFCISFNISELYNLFFIYSDLKCVASNLSWSLVHFVGCLKILVFLSKVGKVRKMCDQFINGMFLLEDSGGKEEMRLAVKKSIRYLFVYYFFSVVVLLNGFIAPIYRDDGDSSENRTRLPYYTYVICDEATSPCYEVAYIYQTISTSVCSLVIIHCDNLYILLVMLSCSQFKILQRSLAGITQRAEASVAIERGELGDKLDREVERESLRLANECVKHHHVILGVSEELEDMYNLLLLAQFLSHLVQLCFQMFVVTEVSVTSFDGLSMIAFVTSMVIEVYVFCQCSDEIETESRKVSQAAYDADWTSASAPLKKTLLLMMLRAERPVQFTVGKFLKLSRGTSLLVLRGSFSYFVVLRKMQ